MFIRLQKTPADKIERYWIVDEIKKAIEREAMNHGVMGDEVVAVTVGLDEDQFDAFESYSLADEFNPLHFWVETEGYQEDTESYIISFQWSETGFIDCNDEKVQRIVLKELKYSTLEINRLISTDEFILYEAWDYAKGEENDEEIFEQILADKFHPGGGVDSVNVDGVWFVIERML